jgi:catecholate siderophore receptor
MKATAALLISVLFHSISLSQAPSNQVQLHGKVFDSSRAPVAGAQISLILKGRDSGPSMVSDGQGDFSVSVDSGTYTLKISAPGFSESSEVIELQPGNSFSREVVLKVKPVNEIVTVTESDDNQPTAVTSATKTLTPLLDIPQSVTIITREQARDQLFTSIADVVRYVPGITAHQGENNRDQLVIRGNNSSADFYVDGVRDDVQYYRDLYNLDRVEALKGPNAMIFGRGGGGGVINRVTKDAGFSPLREITMQGGSYDNKRIAADFDQPLGERVSFRLNSMFESSGSFRDDVRLKRHGINPTLTIAPMKATRITLGYENFRDVRTADRGLPSFAGKPADMAVSTFLGNPADSHVRAMVHLGSAMIEHDTGRLMIRSRVHVGGYDRGYQNFVPGVVTPDKTQVSISAYNNSTSRLNIFDQTDVTYVLSTGRIRHVLLGGVEIGRQLTDNYRNTGFFNNTATSTLVPYANPQLDTPLTFRQSATDANNHLKTNLSAAYVQDQVELSRHVQWIAGLRYDYFDLQYHNNRTNENLRRIDNLVSPRTGLVLKPIQAVSVYGSYSVSYLPSSGDQFSSLTSITQQVKPEKFSNYEIGLKWDLRRLSLTTAVYRLNRTNTRSIDPNDPTKIVQTGSQRTNGYELGVNGSITHKWKVSGGYAYQDAFITSATATARAGAQVAQVPHHTFSLWNNYQVYRRVGTGIGIVRRTDMFAAIDNTVILPGYTRADAAVFVSVNEKTRVQANIENVFDQRYYVNADSNTNISPGSPRAIRLGLITKF